MVDTMRPDTGPPREEGEGLWLADEAASVVYFTDECIQWMRWIVRVRYAEIQSIIAEDRRRSLSLEFCWDRPMHDIFSTYDPNQPDAISRLAHRAAEERYADSYTDGNGDIRFGEIRVKMTVMRPSPDIRDMSWLARKLRTEFARRNLDDKWVSNSCLDFKLWLQDNPCVHIDTPRDMQKNPMTRRIVVRRGSPNGVG